MTLYSLLTGYHIFGSLGNGDYFESMIFLLILSFTPKPYPRYVPRHMMNPLLRFIISTSYFLMTQYINVYILLYLYLNIY